MALERQHLLQRPLLLPGLPGIAHPGKSGVPIAQPACNKGFGRKAVVPVRRDHDPFFRTMHTVQPLRTPGERPFPGQRRRSTTRIERSTSRTRRWYTRLVRSSPRFVRSFTPRVRSTARISPSSPRVVRSTRRAVRSSARVVTWTACVVRSSRRNRRSTAPSRRWSSSTVIGSCPTGRSSRRRRRWYRTDEPILISAGSIPWRCGRIPGGRVSPPTSCTRACGSLRPRWG